MHLVTYQQEGQTRTGVLLGKSVIDLNRAYRTALHHLDAGELAVADLRLPIDMVEYHDLKTQGLCLSSIATLHTVGGVQL